MSTVEAVTEATPSVPSIPKSILKSNSNPKPNIDKPFKELTFGANSIKPYDLNIDFKINTGRRFLPDELGGVGKYDQHDVDALLDVGLSDQSDKINKNLNNSVKIQLNKFNTSFESLLTQVTNEKLKQELKKIKEKLQSKFDILDTTYDRFSKRDTRHFSSKSPFQNYNTLYNANKDAVTIDEYNLISDVFFQFNFFFRKTFYDEFVRIPKISEDNRRILDNNRNNFVSTSEELKRPQKSSDAEHRQNLNTVMSKSLEEYLKLCFLYGTKLDLDTAKTVDNMNDKVAQYEPFKNTIREAFIKLIAGLLDNYPIDIDINQKIKIASEISQPNEYIYGYTVKLKMEWSVLEDKDCEWAIPDGGFNEIGLKMTNRARVAQINEERSKCKHGDTVVASISNLSKKFSWGGRHKTRKLNNRKLKFRKTKRHRKKTNRRLQKKQRRTHKRR
jgi:hypothetical protein